MGYLKVLDARHMLEEGVAKLVPAIDPECEVSAKSSLRLILRWVRQGAFVLEDLSKVTAGHPSAAGRVGKKLISSDLLLVQVRFASIARADSALASA